MNEIPIATVVQIDDIRVNVSYPASSQGMVAGPGPEIQIDSDRTIEYLSQHAWPLGLQDALLTGLSKIAKVYFRYTILMN